MKNKVLIVDDTPENIDVLWGMLSQEYQVLAAIDGCQAMQAAFSNPPDLILLDVMMPEMDGYEVCRKLKKDHRTRDIPVIFVSAKSDDEDEIRGFAMGAVDYIRKPVKKMVVKSRVRSHLALKKHQDRLLAKLRYQALYDPLTNIPNRTLLTERLNRALERLKRNSNCPFAVLMIDLDRFKELNDSLGHLAGDKMLIHLSKTIQSCLRSMDTLARMGGDEFVAIVEDVKDIQQVEEIARRMQTVIQKPVAFNDVEVTLSASIGIVWQTAVGRSPEELLRDADMAMYRAKNTGKSCFRHYESSMHEQALERIKVENELRFALERNEFCLYFQPIISIEKNQLSGFEALIRWCHPKYGVISPEKFIPIAEETGLIVPIGTWVLEKACQQLSQWHGMGEAEKSLCMNINVSVNQFLQPSFVQIIDKMIAKYGVPPRCIRLEITESLLMKHSREAVEKLNLIKNKGVQIAIDDFGTGYSSLAYVHEFPMDQLKIDSSFIGKINERSQTLEVVKSIIMMSISLGVEVVAEGVEKDEQLDILEQLGCHKAQGYLFARPVPEKMATEYLNKLIPLRNPVDIGADTPADIKTYLTMNRRTRHS
ncbi:response regulator receiver modulated diguanylate cyclase/phosphodiesterase [Desulfocicer vacuolatum DSM 3385]|uniref:Response regulator receiver modulated diguanylate cyclase/phosphodiesterase n=2 Tax=Desulfocicer vacuolatum TaxID=2298 RepID=A0A1W1YSR9_9BACT|nr:response regulator receiver modulated diguanylate cyclase/phosphodiesterase [Desulfocicer vacuolatum DSM 3385]